MKAPRRKLSKTLVESNYYRLTIEFKGSRFLGWQKQKDFSPTVQDDLENALKKIFKSDKVFSTGSGRTDTGVHSLNHVVKVCVPFAIEKESLRRALNSHLSRDIRVKLVEDSDDAFRPTNDAISRKYTYLFSNFESANAFQNDLIPNVSYKLNLEKMQKACSLFIGHHDFKNFYCTGSEINSTSREIFSCSISYHDMKFHNILPSHYVFQIEGSGFLKQMVRLIVGTVLHVGAGKVTLGELEQELRSPGQKKLGNTAPACGLYKTEVKY